MYAIGQQVWVKSEKLLASVQERGYLPHHKDGEPVSRRAFYVIEWQDEGGHKSFMTGSDNLRAADWCCDGCGRWLPDNRRWRRLGSPETDIIELCFTCSAEDKRRAWALGAEYWYN